MSQQNQIVTADPDEEVQSTFRKLWKGTVEIIANPTALTAVRQKQSATLHKVLCAYAAKYADPNYPLPPDVIAAAENLTPEQRKDLTVLGELREALLKIAKKVNDEWNTLDAREKKVIMMNLKKTFEGTDAFMDDMPIWQQVFAAGLIGGTSSWDLYNGIVGPDSSVFPRAVTFAQDNCIIMIGLIWNPSRNWEQLWRTVIADRSVLAIPVRAVYLAGIMHPKFIANKSTYLGAVSVASISWLFAFILPPAAIEWSDKRYMLKSGAARNPPVSPLEQPLIELRNTEPATSLDLTEFEAQTSINLEDALAGGTIDLAQVEARIMAVDGARLKLIKSRLVGLVRNKKTNPEGPFDVGKGSIEQTGHIAKMTNESADMLLRAANQYQAEQHPEHGKKIGITSLWEGVLAYMIGSASRNIGSLGLLIPYAVYCNRLMQAILMDSTASAETLANAFVLTGATALYFSSLINSPLLRDPKFFDDPVHRAVTTGILSIIFLTAVQYTPGALVATGGGIGSGAIYVGGRLVHLYNRARKPNQRRIEGTGDGREEREQGGEDTPAIYIAEMSEDQLKELIKALPALVDRVVEALEDTDDEILHIIETSTRT